ncbi:N-acetyltransferase [bacterium 1xD42-67]|nr:N-acetyltransferase [bacterium 1xD42-67]
MKYKLSPKIDKTQRDQVLKILESCSDEFVPPLNQRHSPTQENFTKEDTMGSYYEEVLKHQFILALEQEQIIGLLAFLDGPSFLSQPAIYISVVCVSKTYRGLSVAHSLYSTLLSVVPCHYCKDVFIVRTWSTNTIHQQLLSHLGFTIEKIIPNHRGNGIDTIYYKYQLHPIDL